MCKDCNVLIDLSTVLFFNNDYLRRPAYSYWCDDSTHGKQAASMLHAILQHQVNTADEMVAICLNFIGLSDS